VIYDKCLIFYLHGYLCLVCIVCILLDNRIYKLTVSGMEIVNKRMSHLQ
jgi:hypothetical protein